MKNKKQIFSLVLILLLLVGDQVSDVNAQTVQEIIKKGNRTEITKKISDLNDELDGLEAKSSNEDDKKRKGQISKDLTALRNKLGELSPQINSTSNNSNNRNNSNKPGTNSLGSLTNTTQQSSNAAENSDSNSSALKSKGGDDKNNGDNEENWLSSLIKNGLYGLVGLLILGGILTGVFLLRRNKQREREEITRNFGDLRKRHGELSKEIKDLTEVSKNLSQQMAQQKADIGALKQAGQNASPYAAPPAVPTISSYQPPREESPFPASVEDFLAKSKNAQIPVKYDYKERILVQDEAREGGLLVVRDGGGLLYLVPSFGFFQTKSDYTNYFERYYACARPAGGNVWIRQPATVNPVSGGWQLANQGELEVK